MRTRAELEQLASDPKVQQMLGFIQAAEGVKHGYNTGFGNERFDDLSKHPNTKKTFKQTDGKVSTTSAAGAYQFTNKTWNGLAEQYDLKDFGPVSQDIGAIALLDQKGALDDVLQGDFKNAINKSGSVWASLPSSNYKQPKKSWDFANQYFAAQGGSLAPEGQASGITPAASRMQDDTRTANSMNPINATDLVAGALAGFSSQTPQIDSQNAFLALRKEQLKGEADRLALASISNEADLSRTNAVRSFFGEEQLKMATRKLPSAFEDALQEAMLGAA